MKAFTRGIVTLGPAGKSSQKGSGIGNSVASALGAQLQLGRGRQCACGGFWRRLLAFGIMGAMSRNDDFRDNLIPRGGPIHRGQTL